MFHCSINISNIILLYCHYIICNLLFQKIISLWEKTHLKNMIVYKIILILYDSKNM